MADKRNKGPQCWANKYRLHEATLEVERNHHGPITYLEARKIALAQRSDVQWARKFALWHSQDGG